MTDVELVRALEVERETGMPGPPPVVPEPDHVKRRRLLALDRAMHRRRLSESNLLIGA